MGRATATALYLAGICDSGIKCYRDEMNWEMESEADSSILVYEYYQRNYIKELPSPRGLRGFGMESY
jgi:hypothetical protein